MAVSVRAIRRKNRGVKQGLRLHVGVVEFKITTTLIFNLSTKRKSAVSFTPRLLYSIRQIPPYRLNIGPEWRWSRLARFKEEKNLLALPGIEL